MPWYIAYKGKPLRKTLHENLDSAGIKYFIAMQATERLEGDRMVECEEPVLNNLIFVQTDEDFGEVVRQTDGLKAPFIDIATGQPAVVPDKEMQQFKDILAMRNVHAEFLPDKIGRFKTCPRVRVTAGDFAGVEGYVFRMRGDRKLVIALGDMAVAISGIHHTLLEVQES